MCLDVPDSTFFLSMSVRYQVLAALVAWFCVSVSASGSAPIEGHGPRVADVVTDPPTPIIKCVPTVINWNLARDTLC